MSLESEPSALKSPSLSKRTNSIVDLSPEVIWNSKHALKSFFDRMSIRRTEISLGKDHEKGACPLATGTCRGPDVSGLVPQ